MKVKVLKDFQSYIEGHGKPVSLAKGSAFTIDSATAERWIKKGLASELKKVVERKIAPAVENKMVKDEVKEVKIAPAKKPAAKKTYKAKK